MEGWIMLHRKLLCNPIFKNHKLLQVFLYCLLKASHKQHSQLIGDSVVELDMGQLVTGRKAISLATGLTEQNVRTSLSKLEKLSILTIKTTPKYSIISITNWDEHQQTNQQVTKCQPTSNQQVTTNKNVNNGNKEKIPYQLIVDEYNARCPDLQKVQILNDKRKRLIKTFWNNAAKHQDINFYQRYFSHVAKLDFLNGRVEATGNRTKPFQANLEWILNISNFTNIVEGKYDN